MKKKNPYASPPSSPLPSEKDLTRQLERMFEVPDTDIDPIDFNDARTLTRETKDAISLASFSKEWDQQLASIQKLMGLVKAGAASHQTFLSFQPQFMPIIIENITNLRSTLVKYSCLFVAQLAMTLGTQFDTPAEQLLQTLFKPTTHGTQIIADSCKNAILVICQYVVSSKIAKAMVIQSASKASVHRVICAKAFLLMAKQWEPKILEKMKPFLVPALEKLVVDASPEARQISREAKAMITGENKNQTETKQNSHHIETSGKRRAASLTSKKRLLTEKTLKLDDIKQFIILGDEASLKENADAVARIIVDGMNSNSPILANTCLTLFPNTVKTIPDSYKPRIQSLVGAILMYDCSTVRRHKELAYTAFNEAGNNISPALVISAAIKNPHVKESMVLVTSFYNINESLIPDDVKEEYEKIFPKQENDSGLVFETKPSAEATPEKPRRTVFFAEEPKEEAPEVVVAEGNDKQNDERTSILVNNENKTEEKTEEKTQQAENTQEPPKKEPRQHLTFVLDNIPDFPPKEQRYEEEEEEKIDEEQKKKDEEIRKAPFEMTTKKLDLKQLTSQEIQNPRAIATPKPANLPIPKQNVEEQKPPKIVEQKPPKVDEQKPQKIEEQKQSTTKSNIIDKTQTKSNTDKVQVQIKQSDVVDKTQIKQSNIQTKTKVEEQKIQTSKKSATQKVKKEIDFKPSSKPKDNIRTKAPFATDFDPPPEPPASETKANKLIEKLNSPDTVDKSGILRRIAQLASRSGSAEYKTILPAVLPFTHSPFSDDAVLVTSAIIRSCQHNKLLQFGASLLAECPREAAEFLGRLSHQCSPGEILDAAPLFMGGLKQLASDKEANIRKAAVFCIADMWVSAGQDFMQEIEILPPLTKKLVTHYYSIHKN